MGSKFSWLQGPSQADFTLKKENELEDEESFLYGNEDTGQQTSKSSVAFSEFGEHGKLQELSGLDSCNEQDNEKKPIFSSFVDPLNLKPPLQNTSSYTSAILDSNKCEKIKSIIRNLGTAQSDDIVVKAQWPNEGKQLHPALKCPDPTAKTLPALNDPNVRQALESLQSLIKGKHPILNRRFTGKISIVTFDIYSLLEV